MEEIRWYEKLNYTETKDIIKEKLQNMSRDFVAIGFYLKLIRDKSLFLEDGYKSIWEFAEDNYGIKRSTASRWMAMNDRFSKNGNTPILSEEYISFGKSQLQEMLYLNDKQMEEVKPDMTAREIRGIRTPDPEPEEIEEQIPEQVLGQMCLEVIRRFFRKKNMVRQNVSPEKVKVEYVEQLHIVQRTIAVVWNVTRIAIAGADGLMMRATSHRINSNRQLRM